MSIELLREIFYEPPSELSWRRLCWLLERWDEEREGDVEVGIAYAQENLKSWPDRLRKAPADWLLCLYEDSPPPLAWELVRHLDMSVLFGPEGADRTGPWETAYGEDITWITLTQPPHEEQSHEEFSQLKGLVLQGKFGGISPLMSLPYPHLEELVIGPVFAEQIPIYSEWMGRDTMPALGSLSLLGCKLRPEHVAHFVERCPQLPQLHSLDLSGNVLDSEALSLFVEGLSCELRHLRLDGTGRYQNPLLTSPEGSRPLHEAPWLPQLRTLGLEDTQLTDEELRELCQLATSLEHLSIGENPIAYAGFESIGQSPLTGSLRSLETITLGPDIPFASLLPPEGLPHLTRLVLRQANPTELASLARSPCFPALEVLDLSGGDCSHEAAAALAEAPWLCSLRSLTLDGDGLLDNHALALLARSPHLRDLTALSVRGVHAPCGGLKSLAPAEAFPMLRKLSISGFGRFEEFPQKLSFPALQELSISRSYLSSQALEILGEQLQLLALRLEDCPLEDEAIEALMGSPLVEESLVSLRLEGDLAAGPEGHLLLLQSELLSRKERLQRLRALDRRSLVTLTKWLELPVDAKAPREPLIEACIDAFGLGPDEDEEEDDGEE